MRRRRNLEISDSVPLFHSNLSLLPSLEISLIMLDNKKLEALSKGKDRSPVNCDAVHSSSKEPTDSLRIDRFLRPFTLKAVQELLGKTGNVTSFWMDSIKTHCYVSYSSVEEATATREAVYNIQWPPSL